MTWSRALGAGLMVLSLLGLGGCAALKNMVSDPAKPAPPANNAASAEPAASAPLPLRVQVQIEAPGKLKELLEKHLDIKRLGVLARDDVDDSEWTRLINATPAQAKKLLQTEGFFQAEVELRREPRPAPLADIVHIKVLPGAPALVSRVTLQGQGDLDEAADRGDARASSLLERWRKAWPLPTGAVFRNGDWSDAKASALVQLRAAGYASATWDGTAAEVDAEKNEVRLFLVLNSGPLYRYGSLQVDGHFAHDAATVENLLGMSAGTPLTEQALFEFQDRLLKSGLFDGAAVTLEPDPEQAAQARIIARVKEAPLQVYAFGVGISANTGPRASVEHRHRRPFGLAAATRLKLELGKTAQTADGEVSTHPLEGMHRYLIGGSLSRQVSATDTVLSQRMRVGRSQDKGLVERLHFMEFERSLRTTTAGVREDSKAISLNFHGAWRDLDSLLLPTRGVSLNVQVGAGQAIGSGSGNGPFSRAYGRLTGYLPLGKTWYGQARLEVGQIFAAEHVATPESQMWRAGGDESVRGYTYRSLGPTVNGVVGSGRVIYTASAEVARPILQSLPALWGAAFIDYGGAADNFKALEPELGFGLGVRYRSPVGPLRIDYAIAQKTGKGRIHFTVGIVF